MQCAKCQQELIERSVKSEHIEDLGGLVVKIFNAVIVHRCKCGNEMAAIPDIQGLARAAAIVRALNPLRLEGKEVRFIRRALNMTQKEFADTLEMSQEHLSRWENDHKGVGGLSEKLLRHSVCALLQNEGAYVYDPAAIVNMRFRGLEEGEVLLPIEMVRVRVSRTTDDDGGAWSEAA